MLIANLCLLLYNAAKMAIDTGEAALLLHAGALPDEHAQQLLAAYGFSQWRTARASLQRLATSPEQERALSGIIGHLLALFAASASPERALLNLQRWLECLPDPSVFYDHLAGDRRALDLLVTLFAGSQFLTQLLLRTPSHVSLLMDRTALGRRKSASEYDHEAQGLVAPYLDGSQAGDSPALACLGFQQRELLRIGLGDLGGMLNLSSVTSQLSHLADSIVRACLAVAARQMTTGVDGFAVLAMGKLGGGELNYSSDIDLIFIAGEQSLHYQRLGQRLIRGLTETTGYGFLYRVDMRLRPWGGAGPLVPTVRGYLAYLQQNARLWEKQALLRARVIAGNEDLGKAFLSSAAPYLFDTDPATLRADVYAMKQRTEAWLRQTGHDRGDVKLGEGSIRDIEFVAQYLQLAHGAHHPDLLTGNTMQALQRLAEAGHLSPDDHRALLDGYLFLRTLEHYMQILDYQQTHTLPSSQEDLRYLAQRLGFGSAERLVTRYRQHNTAVRAVYDRHLAPLSGQSAIAVQVVPPRAVPLLNDETGDMTMPSPADVPSPGPAGLQAADAGSGAPDEMDNSVRQHVARMSPAYASSFSAAEIRQHARLIGRLADDNPVEVRAETTADARWKVTIVAYDYLGELSLICGLLFANGFSIVDGQVHTYEPQAGARRKIVDVFTVHLAFPERAGDLQTLWARYAADLGALLRLLQARRQREAQGELAKRVAVVLPQPSGAIPVLHPIDIEIDNAASDTYTLLRIDAPDTVGFLYEFTNALALNGIHIGHVAVKSTRNRVHDTLYVTDARGRKLTGAERERELRAATVLVKHFTHLLPYSPNPETALIHFHEYMGELFQRASWPDDLASLERPEVLGALARLLGVSDFLWDDFLRMQYANLFPVVQNVGGLAGAKDKATLQTELSAALAEAAGLEARVEALNAFKDREMFRIDMRHILGQIKEFGQFSAELTDLVEVVVSLASEISAQEVTRQHGQPQDESGRPIPLTVCVLGKSGGCELGYASDIEVMFIYAGSGQTAGPRSITASEYFEKLVVEFMRVIQARHEGIFEIDLDLRPYGKAGSLSVPLDSFRRYFAPGGSAWAYERQALIKLRAIHGDAELGRQIEMLRDEYVYSAAAFDLTAMRAMRERQLRHLVTPGAFNAKYSLGGLVDVEYTVQGLQMLHGHLLPELRLTNTRAAIAALVKHGVLSAQDGDGLAGAHLFLQTLINALRMVRGNSRDLTIPPESSQEFAFLARRLGYGNETARLQAGLTLHTTAVQRLSTRLLG